MPSIKASFVEAIGNTPLVRLRKASKDSGCEIYGKAEWMNPGGSVKDRAALGIVMAGEASGELKPGATLVEGTAGNTGIGLAHVAKARGYACTIVIPDNQSNEKKEQLRILGVELVEVPPKPYKDPGNFVHVSRRLAEERNKERPGSAFWANQFDNRANHDIHFQTTGPEIWEQLNGKIDGFVCSVGSGGSLAGVSAYLRSKNPQIACALVDPFGAALYSYYTRGELASEGSSIMEGIGQGRITENLRDFRPDYTYRASDSEALEIVYGLVQEEGLSLGGSSGINIAGALALARDLGPGKTIATLLCDSAHRYLSRLYNLDFLKERHLPLPGWMA